MKNKKLIKMGVSLALVGVIGVGATLALLTDGADMLTNKFTFTDGEVNMQLDETIAGTKVGETDVTDKNTRFISGANDKRDIQDYGVVYPDQVIAKDPVVRLYNTLDAYVYVTVDDPADDINVTSYNNNQWSEITSQLTGYNLEGKKVFMLNTIEVANDAENAFDSNAFVTQPIFKTVKVKGTLSNKGTSVNIVVKAAAVQADEVTESTAREKAMVLLGISKTQE